MIDLTAFDAPTTPAEPAGDFARELRLESWNKILERETARLLEKSAKKRVRAYAPKFSTDYAVAWGRAQGWKLVDRESYDYRTGRSHDCQLGMDAIFDDGAGLIGVQGAGKYQRKEHWDRFEARGGIEAAKRRHVRIIYLEFVREDTNPAQRQDWC